MTLLPGTESECGTRLALAIVVDYFAYSYCPYKYDLNRFITIGSLDKDQVRKPEMLKGATELTSWPQRWTRPFIAF